MQPEITNCVERDDRGDSVSVAVSETSTSAATVTTRPRLTLVTSTAESSTLTNSLPSPSHTSTSIVDRYRAKVADRTTSSVYDPTAAQPSPLQAQLAQAATVQAPLSAEIEAELLRVLTSTPNDGETREAAFRRKEHEVGGLFAGLSSLQSRTLHRRLHQRRAGDAIAEAFGRMIAERQARLLAFLLDARRREAIALERSKHGRQR